MEGPHSKFHESFHNTTAYSSLAPPSYETAVTQAGGSNAPSNIPSEPQFTYIDFAPDGPAEQYDDLVEKANNWLSHNRTFSLQSCETVIVPVKKGALSFESASHIPAHNHRDYASVLRCWVSRLETPLTEPQVLGTIAKAPLQKSNFTTTIGGIFGSLSVQLCFDLFKPQKETLKQLNEELEQNPLPGRILKVETVKMKITESLSRLINLNPNVLYFHDGDRQNLFAHYIRVFYLKGEAAHEQIGWKDVVPSYEVNKANPKRPKFEPMSSVLYKAGQWAHTQMDKRITGLQTIEMPLEVDSTPFSTSCRPILDTNCSELYTGRQFTPLYTGALVKYVRMYYVTSESFQVSRPYYVTQRLFMPFKLTARTLETPVDNLRRLAVWLAYNSSATADNNIICAETVNFPTRLLYQQPVDTEACSYRDLEQCGHDVVSGIRLYMNGVCHEPPANVLAIPIAPLAPITNESSCCNIL
ncbi:uncharacterized protein [Watersipora subatra]|uniref:uncharacterized protein n=1 Tax=Watersipora subatra TaxID=2589382 RepID=UPI00355BE1A8